MAPLSKYPQRPVTTCEPCRRLKRKCDFRTIENGGPCSNCVMRKIEEQCVLPNQSSSHSSSQSSQSLNQLRGGSDIITPPVTTPFPSSIRFPSKFLSSCLTRYFQTPELSFFVDQDDAQYSLIEYATGQSDLISISSLYVMCAVILLRRGATVSAEFGFEGNRIQLCEELFNSHLAIYEKADYTLEKSHSFLESLILRGNYYADTDRHGQALDTFRNAIGIYVDSTSYNDDMNASVSPMNPIRIKRQLILDRLYLGLCTLESTLTNESSDIPFLSSHREGKLKFSDFTHERRWKVLCLSRKVSIFLNSTSENDTEVGNLEREIISSINYIDTVEGQLHPYGQLELYTFLVKIITRKIILQSENDTINDQETLQQLLNTVAHNSIEFAIRLETFLSLGRQTPYGVSCMGSAPYLASCVFQSLTCIWMLSTFTKRLFILEPNFDSITQRIWSALESVRSDSKICKHTSTLFNGLDLLNKDSANGYDIKIPTQLHNGILPIAKQWNLTTTEGLLNFQPTYNDNLLWSYLFSQDFDLSLADMDDENTDDLIQLL